VMLLGNSARKSRIVSKAMRAAWSSVPAVITSGWKITSSLTPRRPTDCAVLTAQLVGHLLREK
jgi:hypothetical protein